MRRNALSTSLWLVAIFITFAAGTVQAAELIWQVENPFRFFKSTHSFAMQEAAFNAVRGDPNGPLPADIVWRLERRLNDPDCKDASTPDRCAATAGPRYAQSRTGLGRRRRWATPATRAMAVRAAIRRSASANIRGAPPRKTTSCRKPTRCRSRSRPTSSPA